MKLLHQGNHLLSFSYRHSLDFPVHLHNALELTFLTAGSTTVIYGSKRIPLAPGALFIAFPNQVHGYENSAGAEGYVLIVPTTPYLTAYLSDLDGKLPANPLLPKGHWEHTGIPQLMEILYQDWGCVSQHVIQGYLLAIVGKLLPLLVLQASPSGCADALQSVLHFLNDHYTEPLTRKTIAQAVGYNESHISHIFSDTLKITLTEYITSLRINDALELLKSTSLTISQIALSAGFGSIRSFNRVFLRQTGMTPTEYRNHTHSL